MNKVPIVFCFDDNWELPAAVCITSLLENANVDTFYDIFILYDDKCQYVYKTKLNLLSSKYRNCRITFRSVGDPFDGAYEIRNINVTTYYRLLIPELVPEYDKIMYHDVDVIFRDDLSNIFNNTNVEKYYVAGVISSSGLSSVGRKKREELSLNWKEYILAGNIIINSKNMLKDDIVEKFKIEVKTSKYEFQDMDIINIVCKGKIKRMPPVFCGTIDLFSLAADEVEQVLYSKSELKEMQEKGTIHYNGPKPWVSWCPNFDVWWEYYRKSVFFDPKYYFGFYINKLDELENLGEMRLMKLLLHRIRKRLKF